MVFPVDHDILKRSCNLFKGAVCLFSFVYFFQSLFLQFQWKSSLHISRLVSIHLQLLSCRVYRSIYKSLRYARSSVDFEFVSFVRISFHDSGNHRSVNGEPHNQPLNANQQTYIFFFWINTRCNWLIFREDVKGAAS